jgi:predicted ATPase
LAEPGLAQISAAGPIQGLRICGYGTGVGVPAAVTATGGVHGFPAELTSFIGRDRPVRELADLLEEHRLVTVTGPGGSGKTRLAGEVARRVAARYADGAWLAGLAPVSDPAQVPAVVAAALEVQEQPGVPVTEVLARVLAAQQMLLVLDNCEHVIGAAAQLCAGLLAACDDVRVLATSREPLRAAGEVRYRLGPLTLPCADDPPDAARSEAMALFTDRARHADPHFAMDHGQAPAVARLVTRLDGMPLAIELAAARVEALGVSQLLDRLDDRFAWLTAGDRLATWRHRSLAAAVEWSYQLLADHEQWVFRAVSVFPGPFTLEAAEAVAGEGAGTAVLRLVDCSLLVPPRPGPDGRPRYAMLETLRAYGAALLEGAGEADTAAAELARYTLTVAEQAAVGLQTVEEEAAAARWLDAEDALMWQVLTWAMDHDPASALRLAAALGWWWLLRGRLASQYALLCAVTARTTADSDAWGTAHLWLGLAALFSVSPARTLEHFTALCEAVRDRGASRALVYGLQGRSVALSNLGRAAEAAAEARQALAVARNIGYRTGEVLALGVLSFAAAVADDPEGAVRAARQATQITTGVPGVFVRWARYVLTEALIAAGDLAAADQLCAAALTQAQEAGAWKDREILLGHMVMLDLWAGRTGHAAAHLREALQIALQAGDVTSQLGLLDCGGQLCAATRRPAEAITLWAALAALLQQQGFPDSPQEARLREGPLRQAQQTLGPARTRAAEQRGAALSTATAARYALMLTDHRSRQRTAPGNSVPGSGSWSPWSPKAPPTPRSPRSCTSASAPSARTWTGSGTRPAAAAAPTSRGWP